ncbi:MAG: hypothetical protein J0G96_08910 [Flavobacteriia bacterium]|nr:hypothetical protein [Flavobacteriia bacterium]OJX39787.1 MAG: hypothetical protein BGO87_02185 [Flavobacteriia bacterium 40-80]
MKLDDFIKQQVEQHEEVYDPKAWESLSSRLDASAAAGTASSAVKWWIAAAVAVVAIAGGVIYFNSDDAAQQPVVASEKTKENPETTEQPKTDVNNNTQEKEAVHQINSETIQNKIVTELKTEKQPASQLAELQAVPDSQKEEVQGVKNTVNPDKGTTSAISKISLNWNKVICKTERKSLLNNNDAAVFIVGENTSYQLGAYKELNASDLASGFYKVKSADGKLLQSLEVVDAPKLNFIADEVVYEKGLPFIPVKLTNGDLSAYKWELNGQTLGTKKEILVPAFSRGDVKVNFSGMENGCELKDAYTVQVREDYNLLAVTAFNVDSRDERNKTFLPYALYERDVLFEMQIIDPRTGDVIFMTNTASNPWNGIDKRTGELVAPNTRYVWTVRLSEKANFETKAVYQGAVVRVTY